MNTIKAENITMKFKETTALKNVNVCFGGNKIYGLLGRNGAGKSTLLNIITNKIFPTQGKIFIDDEESMENDNALGKVYSMGEKNFYDDTVQLKNILKSIAPFYPNFDMDYAKALAKKFELNLSKKIKGLSTGYSSIFKLIIALSVNTPYILFDEPVLGLDANHRELFYKLLIENYSENPKTIIISTHLIEEISDIVEQIVIIKSGEIILDKPTQEVLDMGYCVTGSAIAIDNYCKNKKVLSTDILGGLKTACILGNKQDFNSANASDNGLQASKLDLQKLFIQLTNA